jgi:hypothetical protein
MDFGRAAHEPRERRLALSAPTRTDAARRARVVIDKPGEDAKVKVWVSEIDGMQPENPVLEVDQPPELAGVPTFRFGFSAGTGWATLVHEIWDVQIVLPIRRSRPSRRPQRPWLRLLPVPTSPASLTPSHRAPRSPAR